MSFPAAGWLRSPAFDLGFIAGVLALALALGGAASLDPALFAGVLLADLWLCAYPHVASTYTRIAFDRARAREHAFLLVGLPPIVLAATAGAYFLGGVAAINTIYYYAQTWHYARQSHGISRAYRRSAGVAPGRGDLLTDVVVLAFPLWGILHRAHQRPALFYQAPLHAPLVPAPLVALAGAGAFAALVVWLAREVRVLRAGQRRGLGGVLFVLSHVAITTVSYVAISDVTRGWLFINIWHNAQYLLFVWAQNAREFRAGVDPARPFVSRLSQPEHVVRYAAVCLGLGATFYFLLGQVTARFSSEALPLVLVCHQAVNFHHYLVDAVIWRRRS